MARVYVIALSVLAFCFAPGQAGFLDWFRSSANKGHSVCRVDFEVLDPQGIKLWTPHKPELKMFGIELYVNPVGRKNGPVVCNLCKNTTDSMHGKFFIQSDELIVKRGDILEYVVITDNGKTVQRHKPKRMVVNEYIIKPQGRCACPTTTPQFVTHGSDSDVEIDLLERVISHLSNRCSEGTVSNYLFLQVLTPAESKVPLDHVRGYLTANPALKPYVDAVTSAEDYADGISFQMKSIVDKLKILELSITNDDILDFDGLTTIGNIDIRISDSN
ncbi:uncharacterized protein LOC129776898 [Toxorhynchites rutilus septentrionalis]|uniref:uncharacterized protein LOC129776898 n=1 Tax=Toxorhynchites rutilus septentrionalis TaxID=329112 RepID=UPI002478F50B|nr:uncharacterized protein LOC129776898 [Toxorhynchites rutilus septentrionalis]